MKPIVLIIHLLVAVTLVGLILLQSSQGGLGSAFGGDFYRTKRGAERLIFMATIVTSGIFLLTSLATLLIR